MALEASRLVESARADFVRWAQQKSLPLVREVQRVAVSGEARSWRAQIEWVSANESWRYLGDWRLGADWYREASRWASRVAESYRDSLLFSSPGYDSFPAHLLGFPVGQFPAEDDPPRWLVERALVPAVVA
jgi:hypothetical protein